MPCTTICGIWITPRSLTYITPEKWWLEDYLLGDVDLILYCFEVHKQKHSMYLSIYFLLSGSAENHPHRSQRFPMCGFPGVLPWHVIPTFIVQYLSMSANEAKFASLTSQTLEQPQTARSHPLKQGTRVPCNCATVKRTNIVSHLQPR